MPNDKWCLIPKKNIYKSHFSSLLGKHSVDLKTETVLKEIIMLIYNQKRKPAILSLKEELNYNLSDILVQPTFVYPDSLFKNCFCSIVVSLKKWLAQFIHTAVCSVLFLGCKVNTRVGVSQPNRDPFFTSKINEIFWL